VEAPACRGFVVCGALNYHPSFHPTPDTMNKSGLILVVIGALLLAHNFDLLQFGWLRQWWPAILIAIGLWSIIDNKRGDRPSSPRSDDEKQS